MPSRTLPARPDLQQYKKQAKELLKRVRAGDPEAIGRVRDHHPRYGERAGRPDTFALADAQLVVAREHGCESWPKFTRQIAALLGDESPFAIWAAAEHAVAAGDAAALDRLMTEHRHGFRGPRPPSAWWLGLRGDDDASDARAIIVRHHDFDSWEQFEVFAKARSQSDSPIAQFENAVDAIVSGDVEQLSRLLRARPDLIRARSLRKHHSMLLHYVGANGVEGFRQRTPNNALQVTEALLDAGAEVDAVADMYGGSTTVGLVATSVHPKDAGVQNALIDLLIAHGAAIGRPCAGGGAKPDSERPAGALINSCLANGRPDAAVHLANRGAPIDLEGAAGIGRLDLVRSCFAGDGTLTNGATKTQMVDGFSWACEYGHADVVAFLLDRGMDVGAQLRPHRQTGLHWAAYGAHVDTVKVLLAHRPPLEVRDESFDGTALGWALYSWGTTPNRTERNDCYVVVALLAAAGATLDSAWIDADEERGFPLGERVRADARMQAALGTKDRERTAND